MRISGHRQTLVVFVIGAIAAATACDDTADTSSTSSTETGASSGAGSTSTTAASSTSASGATTTSASSSVASTSAGMGGLGGMGGAGGASSTTASTASSTAVASSSSGVDPNTLDQDADGWTPNDGDCCDTVAGCSDPEKVNPGAFEYPGNALDDDCDPVTVDNAATPGCSTMASFSGVAGMDLIQAMDLCQTTTEAPPLPMKKWGVISTSLVLADGTTPLAQNLQVGVLTGFGDNVFPQKNQTMASLSSGTARDVSDPGYVHPQNGTTGQIGNFNANTQVAIQSAYLAPHGGKPPSPAACPACTTNCNQAFDSVNLRARIRVPTNAQSFSYRFKFHSAEFPEFVCNQYNDFFITLLDSAWVPDPLAMPPQQPLPADKNIAFDAQSNPVSVNNGFFQVCFPPIGAPPGTCPSGTLELVGTGIGGWGNNLKDGGATDWLTNEAPVVPGETIEIQFMSWDSGDHNVDSLVLLDGFKWSINASSVNVHK